MISMGVSCNFSRKPTNWLEASSKKPDSPHFQSLESLESRAFRYLQIVVDWGNSMKHIINLGWRWHVISEAWSQSGEMFVRVDLGRSESWFRMFTIWYWHVPHVLAIWIHSDPFGSSVLIVLKSVLAMVFLCFPWFCCLPVSWNIVIIYCARSAFYSISSISNAFGPAMPCGGREWKRCT